MPWVACRSKNADEVQELTIFNLQSSSTRLPGAGSNKGCGAPNICGQSEVALQQERRRLSDPDISMHRVQSAGLSQARDPNIATQQALAQAGCFVHQHRTSLWLDASDGGFYKGRCRRARQAGDIKPVSITRRELLIAHSPGRSAPGTEARAREADWWKRRKEAERAGQAEPSKAEQDGISKALLAQTLSRCRRAGRCRLMHCDPEGNSVAAGPFRPPQLCTRYRGNVS